MTMEIQKELHKIREIIRKTADEVTFVTPSAAIVIAIRFYSVIGSIAFVIISLPSSHCT